MPIIALWVENKSTEHKKVLCLWDRWFPHPAKNAICLPWFGIISIIILGAAIGRPASQGGSQAARRATVISPWFPFTSQNSQPVWSQHFWKAGVRIPPPPTTSFVIAVDSICRRIVGCRKVKPSYSNFVVTWSQATVCFSTSINSFGWILFDPSLNFSLTNWRWSMIEECMQA